MRVKPILLLLAILMLAPQWAPAQQYQESGPEVLRVGHWIEVRGDLLEESVFEADRIELVTAERYEALLGTIKNVDGRGFTLVGQRVELSDKTVLRNVEREDLDGARVKLQGYYLGEGQFTSRKIYARNPGRDRIAGRIDSIRKAPGGFEAKIMNYTVAIAADVIVRHEQVVAAYETSPPRALAIVDRNRDEEDIFGTGAWLTDSLFLAGQVETSGALEDDFDLNNDLPRKRDEYLARARARLVYQPVDYFFAVATLSYQSLWRDDQRTGRLEIDDYRLSETYLYWLDPLDKGLSLQVGRVDFDEQREWLYDQDLDAIKMIYEKADFRAELSYSETLFDGSLLDESAKNTILYLSNTDNDRHIAGYIIHRDYDLPVPVEQTNFGVRTFGEWFPDNDSWLELGWMEGTSGLSKSRGWAFDIGTTWRFNKKFAFTLGYAVGQGDDRGTAINETFRQTGLHDNNDKFGGVTSFRYYGELVDPELANLKISTAGLGWKPQKRVSLDMVWHQYRQYKASRLLVDTQLRKRPNGIDTDLGQEFDLILGVRIRKAWDLEIVGAWFKPGKSFNNADSAVLGKVQFRYRF